MLVGGGFGGKEDMSVQHHAALMAWYTQRPVKVRFSRQESMNYHTKRHAMEMDFTTACDEEGNLTAMKAVILADTGAYASLGGPVLQRACTHAAGPYHYRDIDIEGLAVYTNNVVAGAFRGFGVTQSCFATECNLTELAKLVGISPWEIRRRNAIRPGEVLPNGQIADPSTAMAECLDAVKEDFLSHPRAGIACGMKNSGVGVGLPDIGRCLLSVEEEIVHIRTSAALHGAGDCHGVHPDCSATSQSSTRNLPCTSGRTQHRTPDSGHKHGPPGRRFYRGGGAPRGGKAEGGLDAVGGELAKLNGRSYEGEFSFETDPMGSPKENPVSHLSYSYGAQVVFLDEKGRVEKVLAAYDVGTVVNPQSAQGQIEGGIVMGLGYALTEHFKTEGGYPQVKFGTLGLMRAPDVPEIEVRFVRAMGELPYARGAKGVGELCLIPTAPACALAYERLDGKARTSLPLPDTYYRKKS
jgi:CO/xanthine dehydrogenase Mo-binding subunit